MKILALAAALLAGAAFAANGIALNIGTRFEFTACAAGGSASQNVTGGTYLFRVTTADTWVCWSSTCASGGELFPAGTVVLLTIPGPPGTGYTQMSCRSTASNGNAIFTSAN